MDKEQIEQMIEDYIKQNLTVQIENKYSPWDGDYIQITMYLNDEVIHTSTT